MSRFGFYGGVFLVTGSTLMLQLVQTRILSVVAWYHLAFFVISIAMFGLTAGAVWVYQRRDRFGESTLSADLTYFTTAFALTTVAAFAIQLTLSPVIRPSVLSVVVWAELTVCLALPFFFSGVVVSLALTRSPFPIGRVYGVDLVGAALGCLGVLFLLDRADGPSAVLWVAAIVALAAVAFSRSGVGGAPAEPPPLSRWLHRPLPVLLVLVALAAANERIAPWGLQPLFVKGSIEQFDRRLFEHWNSFSRVIVYDVDRTTPFLWGPSPRFEADAWNVEQRGMNIDGDAGTTAYRIEGDLESGAFLRYDVTNLAYFLPDLRRAAVIGVGAGRDLLSARLFGVPEVTGVEINPIFRRVLMDEPELAEFSALHEIDGVEIEVDEARSWFARADERFDLIQMSLVDTWAATGAGAFSLSENGLYTVDSWRIFLERLEPDGVFTVSRWYSPTEVEQTGRLVSLAAAAVLSTGAREPREHVFLAASGRVATLVLSRSPLSPEAVGALEEAAAELEYTVLASPRRVPEEPLLREILSFGDVDELWRFGKGQTLDVTPPTDERPFFFNQLPLYDPARTMRIAFRESDVGVVTGNLFATATLLILFLISAALVLATIVFPLRPAIRDVGGRLAAGGTAYFFLIGVGFMSAEIGLLQRMSVFLGHPVYSLSIVLFSLILTTGVGSLVSDVLPLDRPRSRFLWAGVTGVYLASLPLWLPGVLGAFEGAPLVARAVLCISTIAPAGLLMGYGFPTGMRLITAVDRRPTPWLWGINGAAGVLAATAAVAMSIAFGISTTLAVGGLCYIALIPAIAMIAPDPARETSPASAEPA